MNKEIPIFFSADDNYMPFLDVAISSLITNAGRAYEYRIIVLNTGLSEDNIRKVKQNEKEGFKIDFIDISEEVEKIKSRLKNVYHFSVVSYYRLFIASLFPQYDKVVYLDCDLVVLGDISELYNVELGENILGAVPDQFVRSTKEFKLYAEEAIGVGSDGYVSSGVLLMNLKEFRRNNVEERFVKLITEYDFDLIDPDQAYLNYLCSGKIHALPNGWNKQPTPLDFEGKRNIVHYALYKKPWQYDDVMYGEYFWQYAEHSPFYEQIRLRKNSFSESEKAKREEMAREILEHALKIVESEETFSRKLCKI